MKTAFNAGIERINGHADANVTVDSKEEKKRVGCKKRFA